MSLKRILLGVPDPVGRNFSELQQRETSKLFLKASTLFFSRKNWSRTWESIFWKSMWHFARFIIFKRFLWTCWVVALSTAWCSSANELKGKHKHIINKEDMIESWFLHAAFCLCIWKLTSWCWNVDHVLHFASCFYWKACVSKGVFNFYKIFPP